MVMEEYKEEMMKNYFLIGCLAFAISFNVMAQDSNRMSQLEQEVQSIKLRLSKLESAQGIQADTPKSSTSGDGWKSLSNWRQLVTGMTPNDARKLLGEPNRVSGGEIATWYYQNGGSVTFMKEKLYRWDEPR